MFFARAVLLLIVTATPVLAQTAAVPPADPKAQALYEFMMARRLEASGDTAGALASLERAKKLDPASGEILAEMAGFYQRQNRVSDAVAAAEQARELAELIALDLECSDDSDCAGSEVQVRNIGGTCLFSVPVREPERIAA